MRVESNENLKHLSAECVEIIEKLISEKTPTLLKDIDKDDRTLLHWSALEGNEELVQFILKDKDVDVNARDGRLATPIIYAALNDNISIIKMLDERGADVNAYDCHANTALKYCGESDNIEAANYLLYNGADVNFRDITGNTPLHRAALLGRNKMIELLLEHYVAKPKINLQNYYGETALHMACKKQQNESAVLLSLSDASFRIENCWKQIPLEVCEPGLRLLLESKFRLNGN